MRSIITTVMIVIGTVAMAQIKGLDVYVHATFEEDNINSGLRGQADNGMYFMEYKSTKLTKQQFMMVFNEFERIMTLNNTNPDYFDYSYQPVLQYSITADNMYDLYLKGKIKDTVMIYLVEDYFVMLSINKNGISLVIDKQSAMVVQY